MNQIITIILFYVILIAYIICIGKNKGYKALLCPSEFGKTKYLIGAACYFLVNINVLFACSFCKHCHDHCITFAMPSVLIGIVVYLIHLAKDTIIAIKITVAGGEASFMAVFFAIPYVYLLWDFVDAIFRLGVTPLHAYESKMLIVLFYALFVVLSELNKKN